jgi:hypothetical protein
MKIRAQFICFCLLLATCCLVSACGTGIAGSSSSNPSLPASIAVSNGPQLGYVWDPTIKALRPILGIPGSSQLGQPVTTAGLYVTGAASAASAIGLLQETDGSIDSIALPSGTPVRISGVTAAAGTTILFAPSGQNAILLAPGSTSVTLLIALNGSPLAQVLTAPSTILTAAVSDTAQVAVAYGSGPRTVSLLTGGGAQLLSLASVGGLSFLPKADDLLTADSSSGTVTLIRHTSTAPAQQTFTSSTIQSPIAIGASQDGNYALVANGGDTSVVRLDLSGASAPLRIACTCQPTQLSAFSGNAVFALTAPGVSTSWMVDASAATPQTLFIPAVKP